MAFREDFVWGAASSAYQTEGFPSADGGGESVWDVFCRRSGTVANGDDGSIACDGYHRFAEDIGLLASLGLRAYRFSTSWARIDPNGDGRWNEAGLQYYDRARADGAYRKRAGDLMYLELGGDLLVQSRAVLGIFDLDNTSWSKRTRIFLETAQKNGELIDAAEELPKSFVLTQEFGAQRVYLTKYNAAVLMKRLEAAR